LTIALEVAVLLVLVAPRQKAVELSILRLPVRPGLHTHRMLDPIILSDDESVSAESETDYSNLEVDLTAKSDSSSPHIADSDMVDGEGFDSGTAYISDRLVADHQDNSNDSDSGLADGARLQLAAGLPRSASPGQGSVTHQASPKRVNTEMTQGSASYSGLDVTKGAEEEDIDVLSDDEDGADTYSTKTSGSSAISSENLASDSNISLPALQDGQRDSTQPPQLCPAAASHHQSDSTNDLLPRHRRRRDDTKVVRRRRLRMPSLTQPLALLAPFLPPSNPTISNIPSQPLYWQLWPRNKRSATLTKE